MRRLLVAFTASVILVSTTPLFSQAEERKPNVDDGPDVHAESVYLFARVPFDRLVGAGGSYIDPASVTPAVLEYRLLENWTPSDPATSPDHIDVIAIIWNTGDRRSNSGTVKVRLFAKIGPLATHPSEGVADIAGGVEASRWQDHPFVSSSVELKAIPGHQRRSVVLRDVDLKSVLLTFWQKGEWAYAVKATATAVCGGCDATAVAETTLDVTPGD